ncbi:ABC transporter ATP-binding protein, partial [uncultured Actinomyces sp.]
MTASAAASGAATPVMSLETVTRDYRQGDETVHALRSTDLTLRAGELVGILGPSGSGKSTLLTIMGGLRTPSSGTVTISGQPFSSLPEKQRARLRLRRIGFVLQASGLVPFLRLNDQFSLHDRAARTQGDTDRRDHLLDSLGITKRAHAYPSELSGGERQRAAIAVALYHDPDIILADEPT